MSDNARMLVSMAVAIAATAVSLPLISGMHDRNVALLAFLYPYSMLIAHLLSTDVVMAPLILLQFPAYGLLLGWAWVRGDERRVGTWLTGLHFLLGIGCALLYHAMDYDTV